MYIRTEHRAMYLPWNIASESQSPEVCPLINQQAFANRPTQVQLLHLHFLIKKPIASLLCQQALRHRGAQVLRPL
jgi:hypothetical protein